MTSPHVQDDRIKEKEEIPKQDLAKNSQGKECGMTGQNYNNYIPRSLCRNFFT